MPISLKGVDKGDYTMIMGFPGSTSRYLTASEVNLRCQGTNAPIVLAGNPLLKYYKDLMDQSDSLRLLLEDEYFSWGNSIKNFGGMNESVEKTHLIDQKKAEEARFRAFAKQSGKAEYATVIDSIDALCAANLDLVHDASLYRITLADQSLWMSKHTLDAYGKALKMARPRTSRRPSKALCANT